MATLPQVLPTGDKTWTNRHETFTQPVDNIYTVINGDTGNMVDAIPVNRETAMRIVGINR